MASSLKAVSPLAEADAMAITGKSVHGRGFRVAVEVPNQGRYPRAHTPFPAKPPVWRARIQQPQHDTPVDPRRGCVRFAVFAVTILRKTDDFRFLPPRASSVRPGRDLETTTGYLSVGRAIMAAAGRPTAARHYYNNTKRGPKKKYTTR